MSRIRVVTDSTADMDDDEVQQLGISMVPLNVHWNNETYQDKVEISIDEFYRKLREEKGTPRTSQPSVGQFEESYRQLLKDADGIVSIHISSKLSGTLNSAQVAARNVAPDRIAVIDSMTTTASLGNVVLKTAQMAETGASLAECVGLAEGLVPRVRLMACVDTLEFLRRGGRIGRAQAFAGNLLSIKLIFQVLDGVVVPVDRVRTRTGAIKHVADAVTTMGPLEELIVLYGDDRAPALQLYDLLATAFPQLRIRWGRIGPVLGTHTGPGVIGASILLAH
ncbi:MAG TPA: DegV family protein [Chloroflexota bacterium]|nr:DegV family protein [Chloroflexota bacterium]